MSEPPALLWSRLLSAAAKQARRALAREVTDGQALALPVVVSSASPDGSLLTPVFGLIVIGLARNRQDRRRHTFALVPALPRWVRHHDAQVHQEVPDPVTLSLAFQRANTVYPTYDASFRGGHSHIGHSDQQHRR